MTSHERHSDPEIDAMRAVLAALGSRLDATADGRAWRLGSDAAATPDRDRLRDRLAATSPDWRAYRLVEQAIAELIDGKARMQPGPQVDTRDAGERVRIKVPAGRSAPAGGLPEASGTSPVSSVLDRIRPVSEALGRPQAPAPGWRNDTARTAPWSEDAAPSSAGPSPRSPIASPPATAAARPGSAPPGPHAPGLTNPDPGANDTRLAEVEAELDRLIEADVAIWSLPETTREVASEHRREGRFAEPSAPLSHAYRDREFGLLDLHDIPEAEVTIVRLDKPRGATEVAPAIASGPGVASKPDDADDHGSCLADVEEASVEIVVRPAPHPPARA